MDYDGYIKTMRKFVGAFLFKSSTSRLSVPRAVRGSALSHSNMIKYLIYTKSSLEV